MKIFFMFGWNNHYRNKKLQEDIDFLSFFLFSFANFQENIQITLSLSIVVVLI
jgi:hypothetical protein